MARKPKAPGADETPRRFNRPVGAGEALGRVLDPVLTKRGFASRDLLNQWRAIAPAPFGEVAMPDRLAWPRGQRSAEGATLYLRCAPGQALAVAHEGPKIAAAINRYFGYVLVGQVRMSAEPLAPAAKPEPIRTPDPAAVKAVDLALAGVEDEGLKEALRGLGERLLGNRRS